MKNMATFTEPISSDPYCCAPASGAITHAEPASQDLSQLDSTWQTDDGKLIQLKDLNGRIRVFSMFYATCQGVCLRTLKDLQSIEASLPAAVRDQVEFVMVTLDPEADTRDVLHSYRVAAGLCTSRWTLLRGSQDATRELAARLQVLYGLDASGRFIHSSQLVIVDTKGRIISNSDGARCNLGAIAGLIQQKVQAMPL